MSKVGRPKTDSRQVLEAIFHILATGSQWKYLPRSYGAKSTVHGTFMKWSRGGVFQAIFRIARDYYLTHNQENIWYAIDANHSKAPFARFSGKSPVDRGKQGIKKTILVDWKGAPLSLSIGAGNVHDSQFFKETAQAITRRDVTQILVADSAYDSAVFERLCAHKNIAFIPAKNRRRNKERKRNQPSHRWVVERTFGWFAWYRSLKTCWFKTKEAYGAFFLFAAAIRLFKMSPIFG